MSQGSVSVGAYSGEEGNTMMAIVNVRANSSSA